MPHGRTIWNLFRQPKLDLHLFQQYFTPSKPPLKQDGCKAILGPYNSQAHTSYVQQFLSVNVSNRQPNVGEISWPPHGPQAPTRFTCLAEVQFDHEASKSECR